jgi:hypothetical protein
MIHQAETRVNTAQTHQTERPEPHFTHLMRAPVLFCLAGMPVGAVGLPQCWQNCAPSSNLVPQYLQYINFVFR